MVMGGNGEADGVMVVMGVGKVVLLWCGSDWYWKKKADEYIDK